MEFVTAALFQIAIFVMLASSFNLIIGYAGLMSIAHPIFFALGAYSSALLTLYCGFSVPVAMLCGALLAGLASLALSLPSLRVSGDYLVIASLGFQLGVLQIIKNLDFTGGPGGLANIPPLVPGTWPLASYIPLALAWILAVLSVLTVIWITRGGYGRAITAMRDDEEAFSSLGRGAVKIKATLFSIACAIAGLAGALYAHKFQFLAPEQFDIVASATILTMVVVGGIRTRYGPMLGAILLQILPQAIYFIRLPSSVTGPLQGLLFSGLVLILLFARPHGLLGGRSTRQQA